MEQVNILYFFEGRTFFRKCHTNILQGNILYISHRRGRPTDELVETVLFSFFYFYLFTHLLIHLFIHLSLYRRGRRGR